jgi:hypothetical protein
MLELLMTGFLDEMSKIASKKAATKEERQARRAERRGQKQHPTPAPEGRDARLAAPKAESAPAAPAAPKGPVVEAGKTGLPHQADSSERYVEGVMSGRPPKRIKVSPSAPKPTPAPTPAPTPVAAPTPTPKPSALSRAGSSLKKTLWSTPGRQKATVGVGGGLLAAGVGAHLLRERHLAKKEEQRK